MSVTGRVRIFRNRDRAALQPEQAINLLPCPACGKTHCVEAEHYDRLITECGAMWFVLRPQRYGPLVLTPHPGEPLPKGGR